MKNLFALFFILTSLSFTLPSQSIAERPGHVSHYYKSRTIRWQHEGRWFHGPYNGRLGWWWIVGGSWHYYSEPYYPYPVFTPAYIIEVPASLPPPPQAPAPPSTAPSLHSQAFTYYCSNPQGYYPAVPDCLAGWIASPVAAPSK